MGEPDSISRMTTHLLSMMKRPGMYCINRVEDFNLFILGYTFSTNDPIITDFLIQFRDFVNQKFNSKEDVDWTRLIRFYSASDSHSITLFSEVFNEFISLRFPNLSNDSKK